jgi:hypothetical protein
LYISANVKKSKTQLVASSQEFSIELPRRSVR